MPSTTVSRSQYDDYYQYFMPSTNNHNTDKSLKYNNNKTIPFSEQQKIAHDEIVQFFKKEALNQDKEKTDTDKIKEHKKRDKDSLKKKKLKKRRTSLNPNETDDVLLEEFKALWLDEDDDDAEVAEELQRLLTAKDVSDSPSKQEHNTEIYDQYMKLWSPQQETGVKTYYPLYSSSTYEYTGVKPGTSSYENVNSNKQYDTLGKYENIGSIKSSGSFYENVNVTKKTPPTDITK